MTDQEITAGKEIIAEFMGNKSFEDSRYGEMWDDPTQKNKSTFTLKYHTSYDWLMPVLDKLEIVGYFLNMNADSCILSIANSKCLYQIIELREQYESRILCLFSCAVKAIEHYNNNKNK